jgi:hypothetical protein
MISKKSPEKTDNKEQKQVCPNKLNGQDRAYEKHYDYE